ncbi:hypothetical protein M9H77_04937 [Catharanthus roseus]|uniref:Uncharacterized protein n=1 Tax=Catharanthus roseus TaxID=4058 RepID=A0ACC0CFP5_CATRO|nr:hypothetical protein M9H77_04937 [Catharanthus roseus]
MVDSSCGGTFLHKTADEAWDLFENLSDNSQQHATSSRIGTSRQIGSRIGMDEVSQNIDLSLKVDALSKNFDQLLALSTLPTNSPNVQGKENLICTEDVNSNIVCITPLKNSSWIENHEMMDLCSIFVITFT